MSVFIIGETRRASEVVQYCSEKSISFYTAKKASEFLSKKRKIMKIAIKPEDWIVIYLGQESVLHEFENFCQKTGFSIVQGSEGHILQTPTAVPMVNAPNISFQDLIKVISAFRQRRDRLENKVYNMEEFAERVQLEDIQPD